MNMIYYNTNNPLPMLPLHLNPYGGYSNNYSHSSSYPTPLSLSPQQQSLSLSHTNINSNNSASINGPHSLNNLGNGLNALNSLANLSNLTSYHNAPIDNFLTLPVNGPGLSHYLPQLPLLSNSRVSSQDGSDADSNSESSNVSNTTCCANEMISTSMAVNGGNGNISVTSGANPYYHPIHEVSKIISCVQSIKLSLCPWIWI